MEESVKSKQERYYNEALDAVKQGSVYYVEQIRETRKQIAQLNIKNSDAVRGLSASQIADKKEFLQGQVDHLYKKQNELVQKQNKIKTSFAAYEKGIEKKGANYFGDTNLISNLAEARGISKEDRAKDKITIAFNKEFGKIEKEVNEAFGEFDKNLTQNAQYVINNEGKQVFRRSDFSDITFKDMTLNKNNQIEQNYPKEQTLEQLEQERAEILNSIDGYNNIQEVLNPENEFNISDSMKKDLDKCSQIYTDISKHKQIIEKIEDVLNRFEVDEKDKDNIEANKKDRSKDYAKLCKSLHKLKQKEEKTIKKLENKVKKPMEKNDVQKLCDLVDNRKQVEGARTSVDSLERQIADKESELSVLLSVRSDIGDNRSDLAGFVENKNINEKIEKLEKEIKMAKENLKQSKEKLEQGELNKRKNSNELRKYTTKEVSNKAESYEPKDFSAELQSQTTSDKEYVEANQKLEEKNLQKQKDEQDISIE